MKIGVKKLHKDAVVPKFAHATDTGFDLFTVEDLILEPKQKGIAKTGIALDLPKGWGVEVRNKSGITTKGAPVLTPVYPFDVDGELQYVAVDDRADVTIFIGTIDNGYKGEIGIMVKNEELHTINIPKHTKLAQGVLEQVYQCEFVETEELEKSDRGANGYGSTGVGVTNEGN